MNPRLLLTAFLLPPAGCAQTPPPEPVSAPASATARQDVDWAFEASDLPVEPAYTFGKLDNGMRYVVRPNATPSGQGMVWMWVHGGSLFETDDQQGLAHFIEHMAFNGTTNIPEGEMVKLLEREGLAFGADTNASTGFDQTIYKLNLPRNDPKLLDTALMLMREIASEVTFAPEAVEREKGVVLSERRVGDTFSYRNTVDNLDFQYPGSRFSHRLPIGTLETIGKATPEKLRELYSRVYRPGNATVIVVGDFDPTTAEAEIREHFATWSGPAKLPQPDAGPVDFNRKGETDVYIDPALSERVVVALNGPFVDQADTIANRRTNLQRQVGYGIINRRLQRLTRVDDPPFRGAGIGSSDVFESARTTNLIVDIGDGEWQRGLAAAQAEYRKALAYGFTEGEIAEQVANIRTGLENAAAGADTRSNPALMNAVLSLLYDEIVPTTPQSSLERFRAIEDSFTPDAVMAALKGELIPLDDPLIRFQGRAAPTGGAEALRAAWNAGMAAEIASDDRAALGEFAYTDFGPAGTIVSDTVEPVMGIRTIRFANGLHLNLKQTSLERDRIAVEMNVDGGQLLNTRDNPLATAMTSVLPLGGLGKHPIDDLQSILAGRSVNMNISADDDTFRMAGTTTPRDLELQLQLFAAALTDPGWRPQGEAQYRRNIESFFGQINATPTSAVSNALGGILSDGDPRFTLQPKERYLALDFAKLRQDISGRLASGAVELALVGDFEPDEAIALVSRTLGAIPSREPQFLSHADNRERGFTADRTVHVIRHEGAADQAMVRMTWPTTDDSDFDRALRLELLEKVMQVELIEKLREELGQTYSPGTNASQSRIYKNYGTFTIVAAVDTGQIDAAREAMLAAVRSLIDTPVDEDTLLRARQPMLESYDNALKTNGGWMNLADDAQKDPERLARFARGKATLQALTAQDVQDMARRYLDPDQRVEVDALPKSTE